jgi:hypothetical protein
MSFHQEDRAKYVESGRHLIEETLESLAEYYENIFNSQVADGSLAKKRECQIEQHIRRDMRHELCKRYDEKVRHVTEQRYGGDGTIAPTSSGRIAIIAIVVTLMTSTTRNRMTRFLLSTTKRRSSHAWYTGLRVNTTLRSVARIQVMQNVNPMTGSICMKCITMTHATRAKMMSPAPALMPQPQVRIQHQLQMEAKNTKMRITIFKLPKE